ncbi:MAG: long-chain fatty acid--CoA ligase [Desulfobacteraceae bacterium]|nr:long-chain fatty acid--CoA ligase [Desulfobacteraceae bacterium]
MKTDANGKKPAWLTHYDPHVPESISYTKSTLVDFLHQSVQRYPESAAFNFLGYRITFARFKQMVDRLANCLSDLGIRKGDSVAIVLPNTIHCPVSYYAIVETGAIAVMNNPLYTDREFGHQFNDSNVKLLITLDTLCNRMVKLRPETSIKHIIYTSICDYLPPLKKIPFTLLAKRKKITVKVQPAKNLLRWTDIMKTWPARAPKVDISTDDIAMYQYTGGTTGLAKGAILTHANLSCNVQQLDAWAPDLQNKRETMLGALPFFHVMGLTTSMNFAVKKGWENILVPKPGPDQLLKSISKYRPTLAPMVPTMFIGLLNHPKLKNKNLSSIKLCISGSAPLPADVFRDFERKTGSVIIEAFGMTESSPAVLVNPVGKQKRKPSSVGIPLPDTQCRIVSISEEKKDTPAGAEGELIVKGPQVMKGYLNKPDETGRTIVNGWLHTGDIAKIDEDGYFYIIDRTKDMIISGGYNVFPRDIDEILFSHPKVKEACAVGVPHPIRGEQIKAFVVLSEGERITEKELIDYCAKSLAKFKLPTSINFIEDLPKSNIGKILRKELRKIAAATSSGPSETRRINKTPAPKEDIEHSIQGS